MCPGSTAVPYPTSSLQVGNDQQPVRTKGSAPLSNLDKRSRQDSEAATESKSGQGTTALHQAKSIFDEIMNEGSKGWMEDMQAEEDDIQL